MQFDAVHNFHQPRNSYHFSADSIHLARFADLRGVRRAADFGAGCGVVGLAALEEGPGLEVEDFYFVEREETFFESLAQNLNLYQPRTTARLKMLGVDWRVLEPEDFGGPLDYVVSNPPYDPPGPGRPSPRPGVEAARRELYGGLTELLSTLSRLLAPNGRAAFSLPERRREAFLQMADKGGWQVLRQATVQYSAQGAKRLDLWELGR